MQNVSLLGNQSRLNEDAEGAATAAGILIRIEGYGPFGFGAQSTCGFRTALIGASRLAEGNLAEHLLHRDDRVFP